jgi:ATP-dependent helicase HepA
MMRFDDRGTAYVMWRCVPGCLPRDSEPLLYLRFDFVVEADVAPVLRRLPAGTARETIRRRADAAFPVQHPTVWLDRDLNHVVDDRLIPVLESPYVKSRGPDGSMDVNVKPEYWTMVEPFLSVSDWRDFCHRGAKAAGAVLQQNQTMAELRRSSAQKLRANVDTAREIMKSRLGRLEGPARDAEERAASTEHEIDEALIPSIDAPAVRIDAAGAVILARRLLVGA